MRARHLEQTALTSFLFAACVMLILAAFAAQARDTRDATAGACRDGASRH